MPPEIPFHLARTTGGKIVRDIPPGEEAILSFYNLEGAGLAIRSSSFTVEEEFRTLIKHIRDDDPMVSLRAQSQYRKTLGEMMQVNGRILSATQSASSVDANGRVIQQTATTARLMSSLTQENQNAAQGQALPYGEDFQPAVLFDKSSGQTGDPDGGESHPGDASAESPADHQ